eukprot:UN00051
MYKAPKLHTKANNKKAKVATTTKRKVHNKPTVTKSPAAVNSLAPPKKAPKKTKGNQTTRKHDVENYLKLQYQQPGKDSVQGATIKANIKNKFVADEQSTHVIFVTQDQVEQLTGAAKDTKKKTTPTPTAEENATEDNNNNDNNEKPKVATTIPLQNVYKDIVWNDTTKFLFKAQNFSGKATSIAALANKRGTPVLVVGLGKKDKDTDAITLNTIRKATKAATNKARQLKLKHLQIQPIADVKVLETDLTPTGYGHGVKDTKRGQNAISFASNDTIIGETLRTIITSNYFFDKYLKAETVAEKHFYLDEVSIVTQNAPSMKSVHRVVHEAESQTFAQEIGSLRYDVADSTYMKEQCEALMKNHPGVFKMKVLSNDELKEEGLDLILAVNRGSSKPAYIVAMEYTPPQTPTLSAQEYNTIKGKRPIAFVGKTLVFDTGGLNLKPGASMLGMHTDKHGGCNTLALMRTLALTRPALSRRVVGVMAITDNAIGPDSYTPLEIINTSKGSVENRNSDAEGRLILASALEFCQKEYNPMRIHTMATLTGAALVSVGNNTAVFTNYKPLADEIMATGDKQGEVFWTLPILKENHTQLVNKQQRKTD